MKELSIFVDESGDFGIYEPHCPYYLVTMVFHNQKNDISDQLRLLRERLMYAGFDPDHALHAMPIIRREEEYRSLDLSERRKLMSIFLSFVRKSDIRYHTFIMEKRPETTSIDMTAFISKKLVELFAQENEYFRSFDRVVVYYDNGQIELTKILVSVCTAILPHFEYKLVQPNNYRLFQAADFLCAIELINEKYLKNSISRSESVFFKSSRDFYKNYAKALRNKYLPHI